nr:hypothetical protein [Chlamydiota bacterium]
INKNKHKKDHVNCGAFVLRYVQERKTRSFKEICAEDNINIKAFREGLADILSPDQKSA